MTGKSERYKIKEMELEYQLQMQREKVLAEAFLHPPGIYLLGLGGSALVAYVGAVMTPPHKRTDDQLQAIAKGIGYLIAPIPTAALDMALSKGSSGGALGGLLSLAGEGGAAMFIALLFLHELNLGGALGASGGGGGLIAALGALA